MSILRRLNSVSLELFYPFTLLIVTRISAANKLLNKNVWGQAEKNDQQLSVEIYSVFVPWHITCSYIISACTRMRTSREQCDKCDSACSVDFHRKFKQTTIPQNLLIKSWRQLPKILFMSPFRQWKPQNKFLRSSFVTQSSFS